MYRERERETEEGKTIIIQVRMGTFSIIDYCTLLHSILRGEASEMFKT